MIVSRKNGHGFWEDLAGYSSRLSGSYAGDYYKVNWDWHRLYGRSYNTDWDLNGKPFNEFKEV